MTEIVDKGSASPMTVAVSPWLLQLHSLFTQGESMELRGYRTCRTYTG